MKATSFLLDQGGAVGAPLLFDSLRGTTPAVASARPMTPRAGLWDRLDHWFWRQTQREREAYLAGAQDIYDLEARIRRLERSGGGRYA